MAGSAGLSAGNVPKQHKQKPVEAEKAVDPAERKRVLNVLAQRRYRQRKREQHAQLEGLIRALGPLNAAGEAPTTSSSQSDDSPSPASSSVRRTGASRNTTHNACGNSLDMFGSQQDPSFASQPQLCPSTWQPSVDNSIESQFSTFLNLPSDLNYNSSESSAESGSQNGVLLTDEWQSMPSPELALEFSNFLQNDEIQASTFADDYLVSVPELDVLRASHTIALRIHSADRLWDPQATSIFHSQTPFDWTQLPENLRPTSIQLSIPHHPILDLLPWPKVRKKLISMYSMPSDVWPRHPSDKAEMSPFRLVCDLEDGGVRVFGEDPTSESAWEVQQAFVNAWWWALDQNVICSANLKKKARGEETLKLGSLTG